MATLAKKDIRTLERYLQMGDGHLLDFSHRTLAEFFEDYGIDIDEPQYQVGSGSKANRMRGFWQTTDEMTVGLVLKGLIEYYDEKVSSNNYFNKADYSDELRGRCIRIANQLMRRTYQSQMGESPIKRAINDALQQPPQTPVRMPVQQSTQQRPMSSIRQAFEQAEVGRTQQPVQQPVQTPSQGV